MNVDVVHGGERETVGNLPGRGGNGGAKGFGELRHLPGFQLKIVVDPIEPGVFSFVFTVVKEGFSTFSGNMTSNNPSPSGRGI